MAYLGLERVRRLRQCDNLHDLITKPAYVDSATLRRVADPSVGQGLSRLLHHRHRRR